MCTLSTTCSTTLRFHPRAGLPLGLTAQALCVSINHSRKRPRSVGDHCSSQRSTKRSRVMDGISRNLNGSCC